MAEIPTIEPASITAGSFITWTKSLSDYSPDDGYVLSYSFYNASNQVTVTASDNGDGTHLVEIDSATSGAYAVGDYRWQSWATKAGERYDVECGEIRINANPASAAVDGRSHVKKVLDAIETTLEKRATEGNESYSIADVSVTKRSTEDLLALRSQYRQEYEREQNAEKLAKGIGGRGRIQVRI